MFKRLQWIAAPSLRQRLLLRLRVVLGLLTVTSVAGMLQLQRADRRIPHEPGQDTWSPSAATHLFQAAQAA